MTELSVLIVKNGIKKTVKITLEDNIAEWAESLEDDKKISFYSFEYEMRNKMRKETRRHQSLDQMLSKVDWISDGSRGVEEQIESQIINEELRKAINNLTETQKQLISEVFFEDRSIASLAAEQGVSPSAIRGRIGRVLKQLEKIMREWV